MILKILNRFIEAFAEWAVLFLFFEKQRRNREFALSIDVSSKDGVNAINRPAFTPAKAMLVKESKKAMRFEIASYLNYPSIINLKKLI